MIPRDVRKWDRIVCRLSAMLDREAIDSQRWSDLADVFALDRRLCRLARDIPRHRERWEHTLSRLKGDWTA